jgi:hypothetical protein
MASTMQDDPIDAASEPAPDGASGAHGDGTDPVAAGLEQFQRAALEAIRAGRAMLDAAESMLQDPRAAETVVRTVGAVARAATETVAGFAAGRARGADDEPDDGPGARDDDPPDGGFERISVG